MCVSILPPVRERAPQPDRLLEVAVEPLAAGSFVVQTAPRIRYRPPGEPWSQAVHSSDADYRDTNRWLNSLQDLPVAGGRLIDQVRFDGVGTWQFLPSYIWPQAFWAVEVVKALESLVAATGARGLAALPTDDPFDEVWRGTVHAFAGAHGLHYEPSRAHAARPSGARRLARAAHAGRIRDALIAAGTSATARALTLWARRTDNGSGRSANTLLLASVPRNWVHASAGSGRPYDEQFGPLIDALRGSGWDRIVGVECPYGAKMSTLRSLAGRVRSGDVVAWRAFEAYDAPRAAARRAAADTAGAQLGAVLESASLDSACFRGVALLEALRPVLEHGFRVTLPDCAAMRAGARAILEAERPSAIVATYETGPYQRALIIEGALRGIPAVGLMHGTIFDNHYDYMHDRVGVDPTDDETAFVIPRQTCVWGDAWKRSLTQAGSYPADAVTVTGNWRYDWLADEDERRRSARSRLGVGDERVVAILSAAQETPAFLRASLDAVQRIVDATPRIRLHPSEDASAAEAVVAERRLPTSTLVTAGTLADLVLASDAVIAQMSSVVGEAIMLDRPTIVVDLLQRGGWAGYAATGACLTALTESELAASVHDLLEDDAVRATLAAARSAYVSDHFLTLDGRAAERVAHAVADAAGRVTSCDTALGASR
jgi:hypothetical protein